MSEEEHDISLEQVQKDTTQKEKRLSDMKKKIEAMQQNIAKKKMVQQGRINSNPIKNVQPITIPEMMHYKQQKNRSPIYQQGYQNDFEYNSTLFKQIGNESQPIINNGSGVSNFSSVSNINQILNAHHQPANPSSSAHDFGSNYQSSSSKNHHVMDDIDKILSKIQNAPNMPLKSFERNLDKEQKSGNKSVMPDQQFTLSKLTNSSGEMDARSKVKKYKEFINTLGTIEEERPRKGGNRVNVEDFSWKKEKKNEDDYYTKNFQLDEVTEQDINTFRTHRKEPSGLTQNKSEYQSEDSNYPPLPNKKPLNAVQRQKLSIKQSREEIKRLKTQSSQQIVDISVDFELSDEENDEKDGKKRKIQILLKEKRQLESQLADIDEQLRQLQSIE